ncbi:DarT ssDNA thymidine ADP-ribosyltransferase family protein [Acinetobacter wanghuae]|uniref:DarT ssDNA thymidine ADP-ribosyltransferase family protein n=1 Tax=Acinetobacter wanghuae TaxID=2662362 RepID=UPI003AF46478
MEDIQEIIDKREIKSIFHFTRVENLNNILLHGVVARNNLSGSTSIFNDTVRADGKLDHSSFSISFPNHLMFYRLRCAAPNSKWAILVFKSDLLIAYNCLFYPVNAASASVSRLPLNSFRGGRALENMFTYSAENREDILRPCDPTDVQAEVMIPSTVTIDHLKGCILSDKNLIQYFSKKFPHIKFAYCSEGSQVLHTRKAFLWGF